MSLARRLSRKGSKYGFGSSSSATEDSSNKRHSVSKKQISAPVALLSTTNMISYTSPSLRNSLSTGSISSTSSSGSGSPTSIKSPTTVFDSPDQHDEPPKNHLSVYFSATPVATPTPTPTPVRSQSTRQIKLTKSFGSLSRRGHTSIPPPQQIGLVQPPKELHSARGHSVHPFGAELAQVQEMTEEIAGMHLLDAEEEFMLEHGLHRFCASDYLEEIWSSGGVFEDEIPSFGSGWI